MERSQLVRKERKAHIMKFITYFRKKNSRLKNNGWDSIPSFHSPYQRWNKTTLNGMQGGRKNDSWRTENLLNWISEKEDDKTTFKAFIDFAIKCHIRQTLVFSHLIFRLIAFRKFFRFECNLVFSRFFLFSKTLDFPGGRKLG